jgi:4-hydroxy-3-polyprenylbenzoate decarboxylase
MADQDTTSRSSANAGYADLHEHIARLDAAGLLYRIDEPVNKDTEMHPLVRWQFRGGIPEADRKAFLFTNIVDSKGRKYDIPVIVGGIAANPEIYRIGMNVPSLDDIGDAWNRAIDNPVPPVVVESGPVHDIVIEGKDLEGPGNGLESLPLPISTPGFDAAPYMTMTGVISRDPETGVQNMGTYRGHLKSATRLGMMMLVNLRAGGLDHWRKYAAKGEKMPVAIVLGAPPLVAFQGPQKLRPNVDELSVAGGLAGAPIRVATGMSHSRITTSPSKSRRSRAARTRC